MININRHSKNNGFFSLVLILIVCFCTLELKAEQLPAFPTAEGGGMFTTGGRGGKTIYVTDLTDSGEEGSFRWAVTRKYPRTVVFAVSGTIELEKKINIRADSLTIAGQTAPGDGITIKGYPVLIQANNIIVRYIRFRMGDETKQQADAFEGQFQQNIIIDHCSVSWGTDEQATFYGNKNFTLQWCIIAESLNHSVHEKGNHGYGAIWGGKNASFHHNLLANNNSRNPRLDHPGVYDSDEQMAEYRGNVEFVNNVVFNWKDHATYGGESGMFNLINNYYKPGKATKKENVFFRPYKEKFSYGSFFVKGNVIEGIESVNNNNHEGIYMDAGGDFQDIALENAIEVSGSLKIDKTPKAYQKVLQSAGASKSRDAVDIRLVEEVRSGENTYVGSIGAYAGIIDSQNDVGSWPELKADFPVIDSDKDGMPDAWELKHKLNPNKPDDANKPDKTGYTMLEKYLNSL
ncbi:MAG: polysaccharide lyase family 1 protein [Mangrovibacterium sp.]